MNRWIAFTLIVLMVAFIIWSAIAECNAYELNEDGRVVGISDEEWEEFHEAMEQSSQLTFDLDCLKSSPTMVLYISFTMERTVFWGGNYLLIDMMIEDELEEWLLADLDRAERLYKEISDCEVNKEE